jgi:hypothetical protein
MTQRTKRRGNAHAGVIDATYARRSTNASVSTSASQPLQSLQWVE